MPQHELDTLIGRAQSGDVRAFEQLVALQLGQVRRFARAFVADDADADDLAQEALLKVYKSLRSFRYQAAFSTWLYAVVRSVYLDFAKSRGERERARREPLRPGHDAAPDEAASPDALLEAEQERQRLWTALRQVPLEFRTAVVLYDVEGHSYDEVAAIEEVAVGTVKSRLSRGRAHLRDVLTRMEQHAAKGAVPGAAAGTGVDLPSSHLGRSRS